jgi:hypothetical protein
MAPVWGGILKVAPDTRRLPRRCSTSGVARQFHPPILAEAPRLLTVALKRDNGTGMKKGLQGAGERLLSGEIAP